MEPRIQYATTSDGVSIAFWAIGSGAPVVLMPFLISSHTQLEWRLPEARQWYEGLANQHQVVRYDCRDTGLSERNVIDCSAAAQMLDLEAVVNRLGLEKFSLFAPTRSSLVGIMYAAGHAERVTHLILWNALTKATDLAPTPQIRAAMSLAEQDWDLFTETYAHVVLGWSAGERASRGAEFIRESITSEAMKAFRDAFQDVDVTDLLTQIGAPSLVLQTRNYPFGTLDTARNLASQISDAHLVVVDGAGGAPYSPDTDMESVLRAIEAFLREGEAQPTTPKELPSGMTAILFADIADSTALTERLGDAAFRAKARELGASLRAVVRECAGTPVEGPTLGDGVLAVFTSAREAIEAARRCAKAGDDAGLPLHLGLHAGDVTREKDPDGRDNVYGGAVNIASRISGLSAAGEVLVSETVRSLARTSAGVRFEDRGEQPLKGVGEAVRVWAVVTQEQGTGNKEQV